MSTEPTDEQVAAFQRGWEAEHVSTRERDRQPGDRTRAGLRAVAALYADGGWLPPGGRPIGNGLAAVCVLDTANDAEAYATAWSDGWTNAHAQQHADDPSDADEWLDEHDERIRVATLDPVTALVEAWAAEEQEHRRAGSLGIAEGLRIAIDALVEAVHGPVPPGATLGSSPAEQQMLAEVHGDDGPLRADGDRPETLVGKRVGWTDVVLGARTGLVVSDDGEHVGIAVPNLTFTMDRGRVTPLDDGPVYADGGWLPPSGPALGEDDLRHRLPSITTPLDEPGGDEEARIRQAVADGHMLANLTGQWLLDLVDGLRANPADEHHTMAELYEQRMLYNAHAVRGWVAEGIPVVKSWRHSDGEECFGGGWFIVVALLPTGQVSNHYKAEHWDLFDVPDDWCGPLYDGHTPADGLQRLRDALTGQAKG